MCLCRVDFLKLVRNPLKRMDVLISVSTKSIYNCEDLTREFVVLQKELDTVRDGMKVLGTLAHNAVISLRNDLSALRNWVFSHQSEIVSTVQNLYSMTQQQQAHIQNLLQVL